MEGQEQAEEEVRETTMKGEGAKSVDARPVVSRASHSKGWLATTVSDMTVRSLQRLSSSLVPNGPRLRRSATLQRGEDFRYE